MLLRTVLVFAFAALPVGCQSRGFNRAGARVKGTSSAATPGAFLPPLVDTALLKDDPSHPPSESAPSRFAEDAYVKRIDPVAAEEVTYYSSLVTPEGKPVPEGSIESFLNSPYDILALQKSRPGSTLPLAAASVLEILRKNRSEFSLMGPGGETQKPPTLGMGDAFLGKLDQSYVFLRDASKPFTTTACASFDQTNYSDLKWTYYCSIPGIFRACHRVLVGQGFLEAIQSSPVDASTKDRIAFIEAHGKKDATEVISYCLDPSKFPAGPTKNQYDAIIKMNEKNFDIPQGSIAKTFAKFHASQVLVNASGRETNMFDYIMSAHVHAFDFRQEQAVLNAYFGELKPASKGAFDPASPSDCRAYREPRQHMDEGIANHCEPASGKGRRFYSIGR